MARVELLKEGLALVDSGPLHATIMVSRRERPLSEVAIEGGRYALKILEQLAAFLPVIRRKSVTLRPESDYPEVVREMILATQAVEASDFTPLAAVAGTTADMVADYLLKTDATRIVVDNGGDISIRLREGEEIKVGLCLDLSRREIDYALPVEDDCGICTSGIGGRSFTLGVANAVIVLAGRASVADAAASYLGNKTTLDSPNVERDWAERIYPDTDIPGKRVTVSVGTLSEAEIQQALGSGQKEALRLINSGTIRGAVICVKDSVLPLGIFLHKIRRLQKGTACPRGGDSLQAKERF
ncbi:MAG: UPF0280 family protein [Dehalococcoidia bacterium]|nr:UPF0280 family protein [Dehalococcoidia bacterium]